MLISAHQLNHITIKHLSTYQVKGCAKVGRTQHARGILLAIRKFCLTPLSDGMCQDKFKGLQHQQPLDTLLPTTTLLSPILPDTLFFPFLFGKFFPLLDLFHRTSRSTKLPSIPINRGPPKRLTSFLRGGYTLGIKNTRNITQLSCTESSETIEKKSEKQNARGNQGIRQGESSDEELHDKLKRK